MTDLVPVLAAIGLPLAAFGIVYRLLHGPFTTANVSAVPDRPQAFGYKSSWLAIQASSSDEIAGALGPKRRTPCNWASGFERVFGSPLAGASFVTPPVQGWTFVIGPQLESEGSLERLAELSRTLGRPVYGFATHRVVSLAVWVVAEEGRITRAWGIADGTRLFDRGEITPEERALDISFDEDPSEEDDERWGRQSDEATVIALARAWSTDPTTLEEHTELGVGVLLRR